MGGIFVALTQTSKQVDLNCSVVVQIVYRISKEHYQLNSLERDGDRMLAQNLLREFGIPLLSH